ncbi:MAG TPA: hypothetical protein VG692_08725 [Gemmatimonadales bacterium]|nr:hypothetical protein [Gemmatimonadales bacterium]
MIRSRRLQGLLSLILVLATGLTSCTSGDGPTAPGTPSAVTARQDSSNLILITPLLNGLLACQRQPYGITTKVIGPAGGTIRVNDHVLSIPAGALDHNVLITAEAPSDYVASVRFQPEGLHFARKATLTLDYSDCPLGRLNLLKRVAYTTDNLNILSFLLSRDDLLRMRVSADLEHFSRYAVAW